MEEKLQIFSGECLCGQSRYKIEGVQLGMYCCHCSRCRKETGSIHGANIFLKNATICWERGNENVMYFKLEGTRKARSFCQICGSGLPRIEEASVVIPAGSLDKENVVNPTAHIHFSSRAIWEDLLSNIKKFNELPS